MSVRAEEPVEESTPTEEVISEEPIGEGALAASLGASGPTEPSYGIETVLPQLADPNDPTLSVILTEQSLVNLFHGGAELDLSLTVPNGINGLTPEVRLRYSSHQELQDSVVGYGWDLELGSIRRVRRGALKTLYDPSHYVIELPEVQGELTLLNSSNAYDLYGVRREREFALIKHDTAANSWSVTLKDGRRYELGSTGSSRTQNPNGSKVFAWHVNSQTDTYGNTIDYAYQLVDGVLYPQNILYGGTPGNHPFEVEFWLTPRSDVRTDYHTEFEQTRRQLVSQVRVNVDSDERLRYQLAYSNDMINSRSDLTSLEVTGTKGSEVTTQSLLFDYYRVEDGGVSYKINLLESISTPTGGVFKFDYEPAGQLKESGVLVNPQPPMPLYVVSSVKQSDFTGRDDTTSYFYRDGHFYYDDLKDQQLAGFGHVTVTDPLGQREEHYFHQGGGYDGSLLGEANDSWYLIGQQYRLENVNAQDQILRTTTTRWESTPLTSDRHFIAPVDNVVTDAGFGSSDRSQATTTNYDTNNGNVLETIQYGEVVADGTGGFRDTGNDKRRSVTTYALNSNKHILSLPKTQLLFDHSDTLVSQTNYRYDGLVLGSVSKGSLTHEQDHLLDEGRRLTTERQYNSEGQITKIIDPRGHDEEIHYDTVGVQPDWTENHLDHRTFYEIDSLTGQVNRETDPNGLETVRTYDGLGREIYRSQSHPLYSDALQPVERVTYDDMSRPTSVITETFLSPSVTSSQAAYLDGFGHTIQTRREASGATNRYAVTTTEYDALGRESRKEIPVFATGIAYNSAHGSPYATSTSYDALDRVTQKADANGVHLNTYSGWTKTETDANSNDRIIHRDAFGRVAVVTEDIDGSLHDTTYSYDALGNLIKIIDATGSEREFTYDSLSRLTSAEDYHSPGDVTVGTTRWFYDDTDNVRLVVDAEDRHSGSTYDAINRPTGHTFTGSVMGTDVITVEYDVGANAVGRLSKVTSPDWNWEGLYNIRGQVIDETATVNGQAHQRTHTYTYFDQVDSTTHANGWVADYEYNVIGELDAIDIGNEGLVTAIAYNPASRMSSNDYGNGLRSVYTHTPSKMYRLTAKKTFPINNSVVKRQDLSYDYDGVGNIEQLTEAAPTAAARVVDYQYDTINRLKRATASNAPSGVYDHSYSYDAAGSVTSSPLGTYLYQEPGKTNPQAVTQINGAATATTLAYDDSGNLVSASNIGGDPTTHDWDNRSLHESTVIPLGSSDYQTVEYRYDDQRRRIWKQVATTTCTNDSSHNCTTQTDSEMVYPFADYELDDDQTSRIHLFANQMHVGTLEVDHCSGGSDQTSCTHDLLFHHDDHLNGTSAVTDSGGNIVQVVDYFPFGESRVNSTSTAYDATQDFTGHELDDATGLHYAEARYYDSRRGGFISQDPLGWRPIELLERFGERPQGLNLYSYAMNNPVVLSDPTGETPVAALGALLLSVGAAYVTTPSHQAIAPTFDEEDLLTNQQSAPSLFEGAVNSVADGIDQRGLNGTADAIKVGAVVGGGIATVRSGHGATKAIQAAGAAVEVMDTMNRIDKGQRHRHGHDGTTFRNDPLKNGDYVLPRKPRGYYTEYVQSGKDLEDHRHPNRMVYGKNGERYTTRDHYKTFRPVNGLTNLLRRFRR